MPPPGQTPHASPGMPASDSEAAVASDLELITRTRAGDADAYAALFARHHPLALQVARGLGGPDLADDLVAEAFVRILALLKEGKGPQRTFGAYLKLTLRSVYVDHVRRDSRVETQGDATDLPEVPVVDPTDARVETTFITKAFGGLAPRAQLVLWLSEVDEVPPAEIGELLSLTPNAVAQLAFRARESLRQGYLAEHLAVSVDPECREIAELLPAHVRGASTPRRTARVEEHVAACTRCALALVELQAVESQLRALLLPLLPPAALGVGTSPGAGRGDPLPVVAAGATPPSWWMRLRPSPGLSAAMVVGLTSALAVSLVGRAVDHDQESLAADLAPIVLSGPLGNRGVDPSQVSMRALLGGSMGPVPSATDVDGSASPSVDPTETQAVPTDSPTDVPSTTPTVPPPGPSATPTDEGSASPSPSEQPPPPPEDPREVPAVTMAGAKPSAPDSGRWSVAFLIKDALPGTTAQLMMRGQEGLIEGISGGGWSCGEAKATTVTCRAGSGGLSQVVVDVAAPYGGTLSLRILMADGTSVGAAADLGTP